jgi:hypothetical protein
VPTFKGYVNVHAFRSKLDEKFIPDRAKANELENTITKLLIQVKMVLLSLANILRCQSYGM